MEREHYADFVGGVMLTGGIVRMDLMSLSATERDEKDQPRAVIRQRIVMPVDGFVRSFAMMTRVMDQLEKQGVIKRTIGQDVQVATTGAPQSVNFK